MNKRIMIVDDSTLTRKILRNIIESAGLNIVAELDSGLEVMALYRELEPDLVIMDIEMPGLNGIDVLKEIKKYNPGAIVIMCSAINNQAIVTEAIKLGASDYILKPFDAKNVLNAINKS